MILLLGSSSELAELKTVNRSPSKRTSPSKVAAQNVAGAVLDDVVDGVDGEAVLHRPRLVHVRRLALALRSLGVNVRGNERRRSNAEGEGATVARLVAGA